MAISEDLLVSIKIDTKGAQTGVKQLTGTLKSLDKTLDAGQKELKGLQLQLGKVAVAFTGLNQAMELAGKLMHSVGSAVGATLGNFSDFEQRMLGVAKTTGQSREEAAALADELQNLSQEIPVGTEELLGLAEAAGQLGVKGSDNLLNFAETLAKLGRASDISGESAARELARLLNITGENIGSVDKLASVIVALGNNFAATESEIVRVASEVGRSTAIFGLSSSQIVAVSTALKTMGVQAQLGGSAVGRAFREIDNAIRQGGEALSSLTELTGKSGEELKKQFAEDAVGVFQLFIKGLNRVQKEGKSVSAALDTLNLRGDEISKTLPVLASRYDELSRALELANKESKNAKALNEESAAAFNALGADTQIFLNTLKSVGVEIGQIFAPAARSLLQFLSDMAISFRELIEQIQKLDFDELATSIKNIGIALAAVGVGAFILQIKSAIAAVGGLSAAITAMGGLSGILIQLKAFFASIAISAKAALVPMLKMSGAILAIGAAAAGVDILIRNFGKLGDVLDIVLDGIELLGLKFVENVANKIQLAMAKAVSSIMESLSKIKVAGFQIIPEENLIGAQKNMSKIYDRMIRDNERILELQTSIAEKSKSVDFGIAGQMYKIFQDTNVEAEKLEKNLEQAAKPARQISEDIKLTADQMKILNQLTMENKALESEIKMIGMGAVDQIRERARLALLAVDNKEAELRLEGKLTKEMEKQFEIRRGLLEKSAGKQIEQVGRMDIIPQQAIDAIGSVNAGAAEIAGSITSAVGGMAGIASAVMAAANAIVSFVQSIIDFIPQIINGIAKIFTSLTDLPNMITEAFSNLFDGITGFIKDFIPNLIGMVGNLVDGLVEFLVEGLPRAFEELFARLPDLLINLLDRLPEIVERFIEGLINAAPRIVIALVEAIINHAPRIALKLTEVLAIKLPIAIAKGFIEGTKQLIARLQAFFSGRKFKLPSEITDLPDRIGDGIKNLGKGIAKEASDVFRVMDLSDAAKGIGADNKVIDELNDKMLSFIEMLKKVYMWVRDKIWKPIEKAIQKVWSWVKDKILDPFLDMLGSVWQFINEKILIPLTESLHEVFSWVGDKILTPFIDGVDEVFNFINDKIFSPFVDRLNHAWQTVYNFFRSLSGHISSAFQSVFNQFGSLGSKISDGFKAGLNNIGQFFTNLGTNIWSGLKTGLSGLGKLMTSALDAVNPANLLQKLFPKDTSGMGRVETALGVDIPFANFADGGQVFGSAKVAGDNIRNDIIPAMLSPGEFVLPRSVMEKPGVKSLVDALMKGNLVDKKFLGGAVEWVQDRVGDDPLGGAVDTVSNTVKDAGSFLETAVDIMGGGLEFVKQRIFDELIGAIKSMWGFNLGGLVQGVGNGDSIPSMLTPGEFVMNKPATQGIGVNALTQMNQTGKVPTGNVTYNFDIRVEVEASSQSLDESYVRNRLIPTMKDELKRSSLRGEFLMSEKGIRA